MTKDTDNTARFWAYSNYLIALARLIENQYPTQESLVQFICHSPGFQKIIRGKEIDQNGIAQSLRLSWYTELLLCKTTSYPEILPYGTPWSMVQTYYAIYPEIRAYFLATGREAGKSHEATLKTIGSDFVSCKGRFPPPWCCTFAGDPATQTLFLSNDPKGTPFSLLNPLASPDAGDGWQHYGLLLRTTRKRMLAKKIYNWKKDKDRERIRQAERRSILGQLRPTNMFDALYRIRARSNYQDIDSFAFTAIESFDYSNLQNAMCKIVDHTLAVLETMIAKALGKNSFRKIVKEFSLTPLGNHPGETYLKRWDIIEGSL